MGMEDRSCTFACSKAVEQRLCTALGLILKCRLALGIANDKVVGTQVPLVFATGGDQEFQRFSLDDRRVIARGAQRPTAGPELVPGSSESIDGRLIGLEFWLDRFKLAHRVEELTDGPKKEICNAKITRRPQNLLADRSTEDLIDEPTVHVGEPKISTLESISQSLMIDS